MYVPPASREERPAVLAAAIRDIGFATLVTAGPDGPEASHVPTVLHDGPDGLVLETHLARANGHWRAAPASALAVFQGPQAYVTPSWYPSKREHGKVVPTWTYIAVHARGPLEVVDEEGFLPRHLDELTRLHEAGRPEPWAVSDAPADFIRNLSRAVVGLRMRVETLEGAWKLGQHRPESDRAGTIAGLAASEPGPRAVAEAMRAAEIARRP